MRFESFVGLVVASAVFAACGARTELLVADGAGGSAPLSCKTGSVTLVRATPAVMFVLDRSGSMDTALGGDGASRWQVLTSALATALPPVDQSMRIGATFFPSFDATANAGSCAIAAAPALDVGEGHVAELIALMKANMPNGATPTADAIDAAANAVLHAHAATKARALVLATDGAPNCNDALDPATCTCAAPNGDCSGGAQGGFNMCLDDARTVATLTKHRQHGLPTYVVGITSADDTTFDAVLAEMATAGGRPRQDAKTLYYEARSHQEMTAAFSAIRDQVGRCTYLTSSIPTNGGTIVVTIGGVEIPFDPSGASGWSWSDETNGELLFATDACAAAASADPSKIIATIACRDAG